jgi:N-acetylmuramoyl-L-alanine amidase
MNLPKYFSTENTKGTKKSYLFRVFRGQSKSHGGIFFCGNYLTAVMLLLATACAEKRPALIAIDVGHSIAQPGASSARGRREFEFNKDMAQVMYDYLQTHKVPAQQIGQAGLIRALVDRTAAAHAAGADFLLSIHHDSVQPQYFKAWQWQASPQLYSDQFSGFSLFVSRKNPQLASSLRCASAIGAALQSKGMHASAHHGETISGEAKAKADQQHGVYYYDNLMVLKTALMPAVLLEVGVIVNRDEELAVQQPTFRTMVAEAVTLGLQNCGIVKSASQ